MGLLERVRSVLVSDVFVLSGEQGDLCAVLGLGRLAVLGCDY